jgi:glutamine synthetase
VEEAKRRGLSNLKTTVDALPHFISQKSVDLFGKHNVLTKTELHSRYEILMENYCKTIHIEALAMADIVKGEIIPSCIAYQNELAALLAQKKALCGYDSSLESHLLENISNLSGELLKKLTALEAALPESKDKEGQDILIKAKYYRDKICCAMAELRTVADGLERLVARKHWALPSYAQMLYSVV